MGVDERTKRWDEAADDPFSEAAAVRKLEAAGYRVARYGYPPGTLFPPHTHGYDKVNLVVSGRFRMEMGGESRVLDAGESIFVPAGAVHAAATVGDEVAICLDAS